MKNSILCIVVAAVLFISCSKRNNVDVEDDHANKVLLLKVDFQTSVFEGGRELAFPATTSGDFTISSTYKAPGDFGGVQLYFQELNEKIFDGTIIWMGKGAISFPGSFAPAASFSPSSTALPQPGEAAFKPVLYSQFNTYPSAIDYSAIWQAIHRLKIVADYRKSNPDAKINVFLYTPSVGVGDPADWDWIVILKN